MPGWCGKIIIYVAINRLTDKIYIGITTRTLKQRKKEHINDAKSGRFKTHLHNAIKKYGINNFKWKIIDKANSLKVLGEKEKHWIKYYKSDNKLFGYNSQTGGIQTFKHSKETRLKISQAGQRPCSESTKKKLSKANKGQVPWAKGRKFTLEHKQKIALSQKRLKINIKIATKIKLMLKQEIKSSVIAKHFSISNHIVYNIKYGKSWRHVEI